MEAATEFGAISEAIVFLNYFGDLPTVYTTFVH
jgi:hypothetical protein